MNSFVDINKCALVYSVCQYYNLSMVGWKLFEVFSCIYFLPVQYIKMSQNNKRNICTPQLMFNSAATLWVIIILFNQKTCEQSFGKICWLISDLGTSDLTQPRPGLHKWRRCNRVKWLSKLDYFNCCSSCLNKKSLYTTCRPYFCNYRRYFSNNKLKEIANKDGSNGE